MNAVFLTDSTLVFAVLVHCQGYVAGQFTAAPPTCSGDTFSFTCTVVGNMDGITTWRVGGSSECHLSHRSTPSSSLCGPENDLTARSGIGFGSNGPSFSSTLSGTATPALNGILFECFGPNNNVNPENRIGSSTFKIIDPPTLNLSCVDLSEDTDGAVNVTVNWTLSGGDSADYYLINITTNTPQTPYGGPLNITNASVTQYELTGFMAGYEYSITIRGVNCRMQKGRESEPLTITHQEYVAPIFGMCPVYDIQNGTLQLIESTWSEVDPVIISEDCVNGGDMRGSYELLYTTQSGALHTTCVVDGTECSSGKCHHRLKNNTADNRCQPPVSQFGSEVMTMSLVARNIVGRSISAKSRIIGGRNLDLGVRIDTTNLSSAIVECTFIQPGYTCTIDYGTDSSYTNLDYRDTSSYNRGRVTTIILSQRLRGDTTYYYIVSAENSSQCMKVQGKFPADQAGHIVGTDVGFFTVLLIVIAIVFIVILILIVTFIIFGIGVHAIVNRRNEDDAQRRNQDDAQRRIQDDGQRRIQDDGQGSQDDDQRRNQDDTRNQDDAQGRNKDYERRNEDDAQRRNQHDAERRNQYDAQRRIQDDGQGSQDDDQRRNQDDTRNQDDAQGRNKDYEGSPLHIAAEDGDLEMMESLVDETTDINIKAKNGRTPLHVAAERGCSKIVKYLGKIGADVDIKDKNGMTPLHVAAANGHFEKIVGYLVDKGATIDVKDKDGRTPLHIAVRECQEKTVKFLVDKGANINIKDDIGWTPLHIAVRRGYGKTVKYLVERGADPNIQDKDGRTPLHVAAATGGRYENIVEHLVNRNADINIQDKNWQTPIHVAATEGHEHTVKALLGKTPNVNITDKDGRTPLDIAVKRGHDTIANNIREFSTGILRRRTTTHQ